MKLNRTLLLTAGIVFSLFSTACARDRALDGLVIGTGSGALVGQAIGHNTESTIIGATVGGILGYMVGNESYYSGHRRYKHVPAYSYGRYHHRYYGPHIKKRHRSYHHRPGKIRREHITVIKKHERRKRISHKKIRHNKKYRRHNKGYEQYNR